MGGRGWVEDGCTAGIRDIGMGEGDEEGEGEGVLDEEPTVFSGGSRCTYPSLSSYTSF